MPAPFRILAGLCALMPAILLGACGSAGGDGLDVAAIGLPGDPFQQGVRLAPAGQYARAALAEGLVAFDEQGRVIPALADQWIVTDDGKSYIFRLREGNWRDGTPITARTGLQALRRAVRAVRGTSLELELAGIEDIREMAGRVIEVRLAQPMPHFLQLLAQPELGLLHGGHGSGPMVLEREGKVAVLTPIAPEELGMPAIRDWAGRVRPVRLVAVDGAEAVRRFNAGEADLVLGGTLADFPRTASVGILRGTIQMDPVDGFFGLQFAHERGFLANSVNREALAMAVDRAALIAPFSLDGWKPTTLVVPAQISAEAGIVPAERWQDANMDQRRARARARVDQWRAGQGQGQGLRLSLWLPAGPGSDMLFRQLAGNFAAIGVTMTRAASERVADLRLVDAVARYARPTWFLDGLNCRVRAVACEPQADALVALARREADPAAQAQLLGKATALLTEANVFIPLGQPVRWSLVRGDVSGFATNRWGWHPLMPLALLPK